MDYGWNSDVGKALSLSFFVFVLVSLVVYDYVLVQRNHFVEKVINRGKDSVVVFVTAHPDDECMFFGPAIIQILKDSNNVYVLCLTTGNFYNQGAVRKKELNESCTILGIPHSNVEILDNSSFLDGDSEWDFDVLVHELKKYMGRVKPDYIFTFDQYGVSGHVNHIATSTAVRKFYKDFKSEEKNPILYELESVPLYRKYMSFLDTPMSIFSHQFSFISSPSEVFKAQKAMYAHKSQLVWFRHLYIIFSRYMLINTLTQVTADSTS